MIRDLKSVARGWSMADLYLVFIAVAIPWQAEHVIRKGISPFNFVNGFIVVALLAWFMFRGPKPKWPLTVPLYIYLLGSVIGMLNSSVLLYNSYTLGQDLYLYVWFVLLCMLLSTERRVTILILAWIAILLVVLSTEGFWIAGGESRLEFTFRNPNRASAWLALTLFLVLHPVVPWALKAVLAFLVYQAVAGTGSAAGSIGVVLGAFAFAWGLVYVRSPRIMRPFLSAAVVVIGLLVALINPLANESLPAVLGEVAPAAAPRIERSAGTRQVIWSKGLDSFKEHPMGIGPASFAGQVNTGLGSDGMIELHSDFVATLVERGVIGFVGYLLILLSVVIQVFRNLNLASLTTDRRDGVWAAALAGACTVYLFYSATHEAMHHDTFWLLLALIFSQTGILNKKIDALSSAREAVSYDTSMRPSLVVHRRTKAIV